MDQCLVPVPVHMATRETPHGRYGEMLVRFVDPLDAIGTPISISPWLICHDIKDEFDYFRKRIRCRSLRKAKAVALLRLAKRRFHAAAAVPFDLFALWAYQSLHRDDAPHTGAEVFHELLTWCDAFDGPAADAHTDRLVEVSDLLGCRYTSLMLAFGLYAGHRASDADGVHILNCVYTFVTLHRPRAHNALADLNCLERVVFMAASFRALRAACGTLPPSDVFPSAVEVALAVESCVQHTTAVARPRVPRSRERAQSLVHARTHAKPRPRSQSTPPFPVARNLAPDAVARLMQTLTPSTQTPTQQAGQTPTQTKDAASSQPAASASTPARRRQSQSALQRRRASDDSSDDDERRPPPSKRHASSDSDSDSDSSDSDSDSDSSGEDGSSDGDGPPAPKRRRAVGQSPMFARRQPYNNGGPSRPLQPQPQPQLPLPLPQNQRAPQLGAPRAPAALMPAPAHAMAYAPMAMAAPMAIGYTERAPTSWNLGAPAVPCNAATDVVIQENILHQQLIEFSANFHRNVTPSGLRFLTSLLEQHQDLVQHRQWHDEQRRRRSYYHALGNGGDGSGSGSGSDAQRPCQGPCCNPRPTQQPPQPQQLQPQPQPQPQPQLQYQQPQYQPIPYQRPPQRTTSGLQENRSFTQHRGFAHHGYFHRLRYVPPQHANAAGGSAQQQQPSRQQQPSQQQRPAQQQQQPARAHHPKKQKQKYQPKPQPSPYQFSQPPKKLQNLQNTQNTQTLQTVQTSQTSQTLQTVQTSQTLQASQTLQTPQNLPRLAPRQGLMRLYGTPNQSIHQARSQGRHPLPGGRPVTSPRDRRPLPRSPTSSLDGQSPPDSPVTSPNAPQTTQAQPSTSTQPQPQQAAQQAAPQAQQPAPNRPVPRPGPLSLQMEPVEIDDSDSESDAQRESSEECRGRSSGSREMEMDNE